MSIRVNLIDPDEKRSASLLNLRTFIRVSKIVGPVLIIFFIVIQVVNKSMVASKQRMLKSNWEIAEPKQKRAKELAKTLNYNLRTWDELESWKKSRISWHKQMQAIIATTPPSIQLTSVIVSPEKVAAPQDNTPKRHFRMSIDGKNSGEGAMDYIEIFKNSIAHHKDVTKILKTVEVTNFEDDRSDNAGAMDRIFQIECDYKTLPEQDENKTEQPKK